MNIKQMKEKISKFRAADVSIIKDEKLRAKAQKLQAKQGGFTLLELLVVITLLATLATAALVAYDGLGENAGDTAVANNLIAAETAIRNFRAVEDKFPNQWDNLANLDGDTLENASGAVSGTNGQLFASKTRDVFGQWKVPTNNSTLAKVAKALAEAGIDEFQTIDVSGAISSTVVPNLAFNESGGANASELELWDEDNEQVAVKWNDGTSAVGSGIALSIFPSGGKSGTCTAGGVDISKPFALDTTKALKNSKALNLINDAISDDACTLVIALGYGKDVPGTTIDSRVAISQVPSVSTKNIDAAKNYGRLVALFQMGVDANSDNNVEENEIFAKPRLIGIVDTEGRAIDTVLAAANAGGASDDDD